MKMAETAESRGRGKKGVGREREREEVEVGEVSERRQEVWRERR